MRAVSLFIFTLCLTFGHFAHGRDAVNVVEASSPNGNFTLSAAMENETSCLVEVRAKSGKSVGKLVVSDYNANDRRNGIAAIWRPDSLAVALNINHGRSITECRVLAASRSAWVELPLPKEAIERIRKAGNTEGGKVMDYLSAEAWLPAQRLKISYSGNTGAEYGLVFQFTRGWKPNLEYLQTIAPKSAPAETKVVSELPYTVRVFAGGTEGITDGTGVTAQFKNPSGLAIDAAGNIYVADRTNHTLRRITPEGVTETLAGSAGQFGSTDGDGKDARFWYPQGLAIDASGNVYVADTSGKRVRKVTPKGAVTTLASGFKYPTAVAVDRAGNVFVTDSSNYVIQKITREGTVSVVAGKPGEAGSKNGRGEEARFHFPNGVAIGADDALYVVDRSVVRKIDGKGNVTTFAGSLEEEGRNDGSGTAAQFWGLTSIAADAKGNLYVADHELKNLRRISKDGAVQTIRTTDHGDLPLQNPMALAVDPHGRIYVADQNTSTILLVEPAAGKDTTTK